MGIIKSLGGAHSAPTFHCSQTGTPTWSGKADDEFNDSLIDDLSVFIKREARRQGYNDSCQNRVGENDTFFHESFLNGWASELWEQFYKAGVNDHQSIKPVCFHWRPED
ncbi:hypothetical protein H5185_20055 [Shewanella sp. SG44-6]|uniref:hypothetical protein n=1 Tax=Shewanella sp. SG44-6 TaxID=2760959 RepID=UPI00160316E3|nr:hypothetical protein [Shewanella sp. SG44-6]MBB1391684.1 hypothetical protein [Shewanella sp. SG44-6]